ncbi:hypothetical protein DB30_02322 [Enhygromyxa salina]|uniref:Uncharacterized protein n=1 Tax=Enhygromyxa salina TaxID=215803 RepID=A0A0C2CVH4_9BACT|nr:hypothetical protein DB30_02322 [Enhygromyxa salina]
MLAVPPPALPAEPALPPEPVGAVEGPAPELAPAPEPAPAPEAAPAPAPAPEVEVEPITVAPPADALPVAEEVGPIVVAPAPGDVAIVSGDSLVVVNHGADQPYLVDAPPRMQAVPQPPWSGAGRFVGGAVMLTAGLGLLTAATFEFAGGRDTTQPVVSQVPAGVSMLVAGGIMIGTGVRDQHRLSEWEAATRIDAKPMGTGLIVGGVTAISLGSMAAVATAIASDLDLDAPRSIPAGWATAGVAVGGGAALLIAGIVRRARYGKWRNRVTGMPMVAPTRAGATVGLVGQF